MTGISSAKENNRYSQQWLNSFEIKNLKDLSFDYRFLEIKNFPQTEYRDKQLNQLTKAIAYQTHQPVALVPSNGSHYLAFPANANLPKLEQQLSPFVVKLEPEEKVRTLELANLSEADNFIALRFLEYAIRTPLIKDSNLWGSTHALYTKRPINITDQHSEIDAYQGFIWNVVNDKGRLFLSVDITTRYIDRLWLSDRLRNASPNDFRAKHCLYQFGNNWYIVQFWGLSGQSIREAKFTPEGQAAPTDVFNYTKNRWGKDHIPNIDRLAPDSPAIIYRYPGNNKESLGASDLCKLTVPTSDSQAKRLHRASIIDATSRCQRSIEIVRRYFGQVSLGNKQVEISTAPLEIERRTFVVPSLVFGNNRQLQVGPAPISSTIVTTTLERLGQTRLQMVLDPKIGPKDNSLFDPQYILLPKSLPRAVNQDFEERFQKKMQLTSGQSSYRVNRILYDDSNANSLYRQVQAIQKVLQDNKVTKGYVLFVLPSRMHRDLHNHIKRTFWPGIQFQCASASKVISFYEYTNQGSGPNWVVKGDKQGTLASYVQNCALGMMVVNRKWPWTLAAPLHYDVYIGIDILNQLAGVTFLYNQGRDIVFKHYPCKQAESLSSRQLYTILTNDLRSDLERLNIRPKSIVVHRDGRTFTPEILGLRSGINELKRSNVLPKETMLGIVDIRKTTADRHRVFEGLSLQELNNPTIGSAYTFNGKEGLICTTGKPFRFTGTAKPLTAVIREGSLNINWVLEDIFDLTQLTFMAPDKCIRLPLTIKLADDFLKSIISESDEEEALYDDNLSEQDEEDFGLYSQIG